MSARYLFGPVTGSFAAANLRQVRQTQACLSFSATGAPDLKVASQATWEAICSTFPMNWSPDFLVLWLPYTHIPACLWSAPIPVIGLAADWNLLWHYYRQVLPRCDLVLTDAPGVEAMRRAGWDHVRPANFFGLESFSWEGSRDPEPRDIDLLFVGNFHPAVQRERLNWLGRPASLGEGG